MKRRGFLQLLGAAPVALMAPKILIAAEPVVVRNTHQTISMGFALTEAPVGAATMRGGMMTAALFRAQLLEGLNDIFSKEYSKYPDEWKQVFEVDQESEE